MTLEPTRPANGGSRPVPDPTELTDRAISRLEKSITLWIEGQLGIRDARLDAIDTATQLRLDQVTTIHGDIVEDIDRAVAAAIAVLEERFRGVDVRFAERDTRSERESRDNKVAVDAAFAAQKEAAAKDGESNQKAIDKSERATSETIKTNQDLNRAVTDNLTKDVDALKLAVSRIESTRQGAVENRTEHRAETTDTRTLVFAVIGVAIAVGSLALGFFLR